MSPDAPNILVLDHLVLTVTDIDATCRWYAQALGMEKIVFGEGRWALRFGRQKINLHRKGSEFEPKALHPTPGSTDLCLLTDTPITEVMTHFSRLGIPIECGPAERTGATGLLQSVYVRDPDGNLIEIANAL